MATQKTGRYGGATQAGMNSAMKNASTLGGRGWGGEPGAQQTKSTAKPVKTTASKAMPSKPAASKKTPSKIVPSAASPTQKITRGRYV